MPTDVPTNTTVNNKVISKIHSVMRNLKTTGGTPSPPAALFCFITLMAPSTCMGKMGSSSTGMYFRVSGVYTWSSLDSGFNSLA